MGIKRKALARGMVKSLGLVFGDIGTSPIYTLSVIFLILPVTAANVLGVLSLVFWTLTILVTVEYSWLAMSLGKRGEGGTIVLKELLIPLLKRGRPIAFVTLLSYAGISLLIGDGVLTPAISILSAVEGLRLVPGNAEMGQNTIVLLAAAIAVCLFAFQRKGTERMAAAFGPFMLLWFIVLGTSGMASIATAPLVLSALSPHYALSFLSHHGIEGFFVLSEVVLCATGGEALYADMGHLGREPIIKAWYFVFVALALNYLGQGAYLLSHPVAAEGSTGRMVLFEMVQYQAPSLYLPFLFLSVMATIIASQAMISGIFSVVFQGISTGIFPLFKVDYTSADLRSQIYVGAANWFLLASVLFIMYEFGESSKLAAAYGLAVTGTMTLTGVMMALIFHLRKKPWLAALSALISVVDLVYLLSNTMKIPHGGYWSLVLAAVPFLLILLYTRGQRRLYGAMVSMDSGAFLKIYTHRHTTEPRVLGTALYFTRYDGRSVPPFIYNTMFMNGIIYDHNIIVSMSRRDDPFGVTGYFKEDIAPGFEHFEIQYGYMEVFDVEDVLREAGIESRAIFYGLEDIATRNVVWKVFVMIKRLCPTFVQFHRLPAHRLHGVLTRVEI